MDYNNLTDLNYNAGIYIRLSQEDKDKKYETDSESVSNQRDILKKYCINNGFNLINEYVDDGYSGTTFDRPGFQKMIEDIELKKINLVIVKDLSRLGRDHVMTGYYVESYFPENKVRFISIMENYDSMKNQASNDSSTFIIACNDYYSKQNSIKIRSVLDAKRKEGKFIGSKPCYGYMRDPEDKGHLIVDTNVAGYVKMMFEWRADGIGISEIATRLNNIGAPTPSAYKNLPLSERVIDKTKWTIHTVNKILSNEMYTGNMVQHKQAKVNYKSKKKITLDESDWISVEKTHEPLVDEETFRIIKEKRKERKRTSNIKTDRPRRILEGIIFCKECSNRISVQCRNGYWTMNCNRYSRDPIRGRCTSHFFPYDYFEGQVLKQLKDLLNTLFSEFDIDDLNNEIIKRSNYNTDSLTIKKEKYIKEKEKLSNAIQTIYQDRIEGNITIEQYKMLAVPYEKKINEINESLESIEVEIIKIKQSSSKIPNYTKKIKKLLDIEKPNRDLIQTLIERIDVDENRNINIKFKYDILDEFSFKYKNPNKPRNPYGRNGKKEKITS